MRGARPPLPAKTCRLTRPSEILPRVEHGRAIAKDALVLLGEARARLPLRLRATPAAGSQASAARAQIEKASDHVARVSGWEAMRNANDYNRQALLRSAELGQ